MGERILVTAGILNLLVGFLTGFFYAVKRMKDPAPSRYVSASHIGPLMQGPMLLSMVAGVRFWTLSANMLEVAAWLLALSSIFIVAKDLVHSITGIKDEFTEKPLPGRILGALGVILGLAGVGIYSFGVLRGMI